MVAHEQAPAAHQLQAALQIQILDPSHPSLQSSPHHSPLPPASSTSSHSPPLQVPHTDSPEAAAYFYQAHSLSDDQQQQPVQEQLQHLHLSTQQNPPSEEELDWPILDQTYQYSPMGAHPAPSWDLPSQQSTIQNHHPQEETMPRHFSSPHQAQTLPQQSQPSMPPHRPPSTLANDLSQDQMVHTMIQHHRVSPPTTTTTAQSHDLNLADSPSWNSAMTNMTMADPLHFYYPPQEQSRVQQLPDSSLRRQRSHLSIAPQPSPVHQYNQDPLHNTQQQPQHQHQFHAEMVAAVRRNSDPEYLQHYGATFHHPRQYYLSDPEQEVVVQSSPIHQHFQPRQQLHHALQAQPPLSPHDPRYLEQIQQARFLVEPMGTTNMIKFDSPVHLTPPLRLD
ncbi:hypothetical protein NP233_g11492 [Leucocoprinus birnbaumii]|uniref:Uncharacterized protein n=1 Tax=Leucocoprinus birnbaumii TaxID=56174 RepID=A0AAD5VH28_9AGAR|nr:hypothetical protein NP233_g11492 [Leucocoprinus birnbaumii]